MQGHCYIYILMCTDISHLKYEFNILTSTMRLDDKMTELDRDLNKLKPPNTSDKEKSCQP